ncbi:MAG TPA: SBBP repeat-containing protein, partial [Terriglobales bacterium]
MRLNRHQLGNSGMQNFAGLVRSAFTVLTALALGLTAVANAQSHHSQTSVPSNGADAARVRAAYAQLPLIFEQNQGQTDSQVKFLAHGNDYGLFLTRNAAVLSLQQTTAEKLQRAVLNMQLVGANADSAIAGTDRLPGTSSYFIGNDPSMWHKNIPQYARVRYASVYPGVDLVYYGNQGKLEYDFHIAAQVDPSELKLHFAGSDNLKLVVNGDLVIATKAGDVHLHAPQVYQQFGMTRREVSSRYVLSADNNVQFSLGTYDHSRELVIDPILTYSTYLGGTGSESCSAILGTANAISGCPAITTDAISNVYIAGISNSADFPNPTAAPTKTGTANVFIAKINTNGTGAAQLINSVFLGGNGTDFPAGIVIDSGFHVIVAGTTSSTNFPVIKAYQGAPASAGNHVFVTELDLTSDTLDYSTYLSGNGVDTASGVTLDGSSNIYVTGTTTSTDTPSQSDVFPSTLGSFQSASRATNQFFFTKLNPASSGVASVLYSSYFGGGTPANGVTVGGGIAVDIGGNVFLTGGTNFLNTQNNPSLDFPILNASQICLDMPVNPSGTCSVAVTATDAFVAKFAPVTGSTNQFTLNYSTYLGGSGSDIGYGIAVDTSTEAFVTGSTTSTDFI